MLFFDLKIFFFSNFFFLSNSKYPHFLKMSLTTIKFIHQTPPYCFFFFKFLIFNFFFPKCCHMCTFCCRILKRNFAPSYTCFVAELVSLVLARHRRKIFERTLGKMFNQLPNKAETPPLCFFEGHRATPLKILR